MRLGIYAFLYMPLLITRVVFVGHRNWLVSSLPRFTQLQFLAVEEDLTDKETYKIG